MKNLLAVVVFCLPAFGQMAYSGLGVYSAPAAYGSGPGVAPSLSQTLTAGSSPTLHSNATDGAVFTTVLSAASTVTTGADLRASMAWGIVNGTTAGTWQLQAAVNGTGTTTIKAGSSCRLN